MSAKPNVISQGRFLSLVEINGWEFAQRVGAEGVVAVAAVTSNNDIVLVEQFRPPVNAHVIELPAGLSGDSAEHAGEAHELAARRELKEETGFVSDSWEEAACPTTSAGMTDEDTTMFIARNATKVEAGGGVEGEDITTHVVPLGEVDAWLKQQQESGKRVDVRVYVGLYLLR